MARQLEQWKDSSDSSEPVLVSLLNKELPPPFSLEWYRFNPRLTMDRLAQFDCNPDFTPYYDEGDL
jgi:hypothetical protein